MSASEHSGSSSSGAPSQGSQDGSVGSPAGAPALGLPAFLAAGAAAASGRAAAFERLSCLGEGAFGAVWHARRREDGRAVALKEISRGRVAGSDAEARRLWEERDALTAIAEARQDPSSGSSVSPALVGLVESYTTPMALCLVMDLAEGIPLHELLRRAHRFPEDNARWCTAEVAGALGWLHGAGWLYRDLKLSNVILSAHGARVRLVDFGFAKKAARANSIVGTLHTMAPEVIRCADLDGALGELAGDYGREVDWWSLGVLLFELLVGDAPFGYCEDVHLEGQQLLEAQVRSAEAGLPWPEPPPGPEACAAASALLQLEAEGRLGVRGGVAEVREHDFFAAVNWQAVSTEGAPGPPLKALDEELAARREEQPRRFRRGQPNTFPLMPGAPDPFEGF